ncbi:MAG: heme lyase CcmF/NrfE family subunit [Hyphomicrobiales bacterium]|nr:heme lyase CcmF/NrfE family subunit [Hyphomicrobiales bacterium]
MSVELGHFALILALTTAVVQGSLPLIGAARGYLPWIEVARTAAVAQFLLVALAFACLMHAFIVSDFSVLNVAANSHSAKPMLYKIAGTWGSHEGSMLLWVLILGIFGAALAIFGNNLPPTLRARALAVQAWVALGFYLFIVLSSNPFERIDPAPIDGQGLNPLLQDPGLAFHPPFLYLGYVGFSMAYSFAIAALIEGRVDAGWARWVRPWTLAAWIFLTIGITLGSWWAYYELGWGGWWFWDPVENASLIPWLAGTALLHSAIVVEKRDALKGWTVFLAIVTFGFSLIGTFLVRSGVLTSVHAFATDPERGVFILGLLVVYIGGAFMLFAWRGPSLSGGGVFKPVSREGSLLFNNLILSTAAASVLLGTLYPLLLEGITGDKISVGAPFFNAVFVPLMLPLVFAMAVGPMLPWKRSDLGVVFRRLSIAMVGAAVVAALAWVVMGSAEPLGLVGLGFAAWLFVGTLIELTSRIKLFTAPVAETARRLAGLPRSAWGMTFAHAGLAVAIAGMTGAAVWKQESIVVLKPGQHVEVAGYDYVYNGAKTVPGANYVAERGDFTVRRDGAAVAQMQPEKRRYTVERQETTEAAIRTTFWGDLYLAIGNSDEHGGRVVRIYFNPLVVWIWTGMAIMVIGGGLSLTDRRYRVGAPVRRGKVPLPAGTATSQLAVDR